MGIYHYESVDVDCTWSLVSGAWSSDKAGKLNITKINDVVTLHFSAFDNTEIASATTATFCVCSFSVPKRFRPRVTLAAYNLNNTNSDVIYPLPVVENAVSSIGEVRIVNNPSLSDDDAAQGIITVGAFGGVTNLDFNIKSTTISYKTKSFLNE